jgi:hypothetical protein
MSFNLQRPLVPTWHTPWQVVSKHAEARPIGGDRFHVESIHDMAQPVRSAAVGMLLVWSFSLDTPEVITNTNSPSG